MRGSNACEMSENLMALNLRTTKSISGTRVAPTLLTNGIMEIFIEGERGQ